MGGVIGAIIFIAALGFGLWCLHKYHDQGEDD